MKFGMKYMLMSAMGGGEGGGEGGGGNPNPNPAPVINPNPITDPQNVDPNAGLNTPDWLKGIDADLVNDPIMKNHKDIPSLVKSYVHAARMVGADKVVVPGKNATPEEIKNYISKLGLPDSTDKYEVKIGEDSLFSGDKSKALKELALQNNILPSQLQSVMDFVEKNLSDLVGADEKESMTERINGINGLKQEWGEEGFKKNAHLAHVTAKHFGGDDFIKHLNETGLGDNPALIKVFAEIGSKLKEEDVFKRDITGQYGKTKAEAQREINAMFSDPAYLTKSHPSHNDKVQEMLKLQGILHGTN